MKRLLASAAGIVVMASASSAQAPFADVPRDHWAYECVNTLAQRGLVIGYPDGTYGGKRAMTRYEFAVVICRMIPQLEEYIRTQVTQQVSPLESRITALEGRPTGTGPAPTGGATKEEVNALRRLVDEFGPELRSMRVDVDALRRDLAALTERVAVLEDEVGRVKVTGELNTIARMSATDRDSLDRGVVMTDTNGRALNQFNNLLEWSQVMYDLDLNITGRVTDKIKANAILNVGNYMGGFAGANLWTPTPYPFPYGASTFGSTNAEFNAYKAYIEAPLSVGPLGSIDVEAGKLGVQFTPYTLKLQDYDRYTNINKSDNGDYIVTGVKAKANILGVGLLAYAGTHGNQDGPSAYPLYFTAGYTPRPANPYFEQQLALFPSIPVSVVDVDQSAGVHATLGIPFDGTLGLTYFEGGLSNSMANNGVTPVRRAQVFGANVAMNLMRNIGLSAEFSSSNLLDTTSPDDREGVYPRDMRNAYDARLSMGLGKLDLTAGYRQVDPFFGAPGYWGALGSWKNPTNIRGWVGSASFALSSRIALEGSYDNYRSVVRGVGPAGTALETNGDTKLQRFTAGLKYNVTSANQVDLGMEQVHYTDIANAAIVSPNGDTKETYYNIGLATSLADNASLKLLYQIVDYDNHFFTNGDDAKGNVAVAQFQVKF